MTLIAIVLMIIDGRTNHLQFVRQVFALPIAAVHYFVDFPVRIAYIAREEWRSHQILLANNKALSEQNLLLRANLQRLIALESENTYLKALLKSSKSVRTKVLIADILAVDTEPFINQVVLNKGKRDGLYIGQPVLDATGVMGQVIHVGPISSRLLLINDQKSGVAVQNVRSGARATAVGDGYSGKLRLLYVPKTADIKINDIFITSGLSNHYPEGYPVGRVVYLHREPAGQFATVYLEPSARLSSSHQVLLVWSPKHA